MSLTRKNLAKYGLEAEQIEEIISSHLETVNALKAEAADLKEKADELSAVTKERDEAKAKLAEALKAGGDAQKVQAAFDKYKADVEAKEAASTKAALVREALTAAKANPKAVDLLMKSIDLATVELDNGKLKDADGVLKPIKEQYADFFGTDDTKGVPGLTPPAGGNNTMTIDDIMAIDDVEKQRAAIAQNLDLFTQT